MEIKKGYLNFSIRNLNILYSIMTLLSLSAFVYFFAHIIIKKEYEKLDKDLMEKLMSSFDSQLEDKLNVYSSIANSESEWDEIHEYGKNFKKNFLKKTYDEETIKKYGINFLTVKNKKEDFKEVIYLNKTSDYEKKNILKILEKFRNFENAVKYDGSIDFKNMGGDYYILFSSSLKRTNKEGQSTGYLVLGKKLDELITKDISQKMKYPLRFLDWSKLEKDLQRKYLFEGNVIDIKSDNLMVGSTFIRNMAYDPVGIVKLEHKRRFNMMGQKIINKVVSYVFLFGFMIFFLRALVTDKVIIKRISRLSKEARFIEETFDLSYRVKSGNEKEDEIGLLASKFNQMLDVIEERHKSISVILKQMDQGLLIVDKNGVVQSEFSNESVKIFGILPAGKKLYDLLNMKKEYCSNIISGFFSEILPLDDLLDLCPKEIEINERRLSISFTPIKDHQKKVDYILIILTDITNEKILEDFSRKRDDLNRSIVSILGAVDLYWEIESKVNNLESLINKSQLFKIEVHDLKSRFLFLNMDILAESCFFLEKKIEEQGLGLKDAFLLIKKEFSSFHHEIETVIGPLLRKSDSEVISLSGLNLSKNYLKSFLSNSEIHEFDRILHKESLRKHLSWMEKVVESTAEKLEKKVAPIEWKGDALVDLRGKEKVFNQLHHIINNMIDHGIEDEKERVSKGKIPFGKIKIEMIESDFFYEILISDDGRGIDIEEVKQKCIDSFGESFVKGLKEKELTEMIFSYGLSTNDEKGKVSGQGLGLFGLKREIDKIDAKVSIDNRPEKGVTFHLTFSKNKSESMRAA